MSPVVAIAMTVVAIAAGGDATASAADCDSDPCQERVARKQCSQTDVVPCLRRAALHWGVPTATLLRKARCESSLNPFAVSPDGAIGLMQFMPGTFASTPYRRHPLTSAKWSALAAGWMHHVGRGREWSCL